MPQIKLDEQKAALGPFILNYISNTIKAQNNFGVSTSIETFEKKLLRGEMFADVTGIKRTGLQEMYDMLRSGKYSDNLYNPNIKPPQETEAEKEREILLAEKRKKERALARLKTLFLYNDDEMPETEFYIARKEITDDIARIDERLEIIEESLSSSLSITDNDFVQRASYFIMSQQLLEKRFVNFDTLIRKSDPKIIRDFINSVIKKIVILDGKIVSILFKNGIEHEFLYNE